MCTHPIDLIKVRKQLLGEQIAGPKVNAFRIGINVVKQEGLFGLYQGLSASLARQFTYSAARIGSYPYMKTLIQRDEKVPLGVFGKISAASKMPS
jgi:dicarboxylate transporter 10